MSTFEEHPEIGALDDVAPAGPASKSAPATVANEMSETPNLEILIVHRSLGRSRMHGDNRAWDLIRQPIQQKCHVQCGLRSERRDRGELPNRARDLMPYLSSGKQREDGRSAGANALLALRVTPFLIRNKRVSVAAKCGVNGSAERQAGGAPRPVANQELGPRLPGTAPNLSATRSRYSPGLPVGG